MSADVRQRIKASPHWIVRVDVLMVAMPQEKLLPMLPDLRDPTKIDAAVANCCAVRRKRADGLPDRGGARDDRARWEAEEKR